MKLMSNKCCICGELIEDELSGWDEGCNAWPVADGRCCHECDGMVVIPARMSNFFNKNKESK